MAYLVVSKKGFEYIFLNKPYRVNNRWSDIKEDNVLTFTGIRLPKHTIESIINQKLTWENEPYYLNAGVPANFKQYQTVYRVSNSVNILDFTPRQIIKIRWNDKLEQYLFDIVANLSSQVGVVTTYNKELNCLENDNAKYFETRELAIAYHNKLVNDKINELESLLVS